MLLKWGSFQKCSLVFKREWVAITILEATNHMFERDSKIFSCFLDVRKAFDTVWIDGLLYKLFSELGIRGRIYEIYTQMSKHKFFYEGSLSRKINLSQGTEQGRILAPFMYKVYVNGLLKVGHIIIAMLSLLMDFAFLLPHLPMTSLHLHCTRLFSKPS